MCSMFVSHKRKTEISGYRVKRRQKEDTQRHLLLLCLAPKCLDIFIVFTLVLSDSWSVGGSGGEAPFLWGPSAILA